MTGLKKRKFGKSGLSVSILGYGAGRIGDPAMPAKAVDALLGSVLDLGINLIDTARGYGLSEERIGAFLAASPGRRDGVVLSTKIGYGIEGFADWTGGCVAAGVDEALKRLRTDRIDIVHLHSCPRETLERGEVIDALEACVRAGKVLVAAYSGENEALDFALHSGRFGSVQTSINICDQRIINGALPFASRSGLGVIAKRPVANSPWRFESRPHGDYAEEYWHRWKTMAVDPEGMDWNELALRFTAYLPGVSSCIVGTVNMVHLKQNIEAVGKGSLSPRMMGRIQEAFRKWDRDWVGQV